MKKKSKLELWIAFGAIALVYIGVLILEQTVNSSSIIFTVLKKGAIYSLVAVSMNLLNGFTGLFSLGQAGFMLIGAYTYSIFTMPVSVKITEQVYKYYQCAIPFETGIFVGLVCAGLAAALFAALIGLPVLRLKSDYLAIATIGFAEILRAIFQWDVLGPLTNGANVMRKYLDLTAVKIPFTDIPFPPTLYVFLISGLCIGLIVLLINSSYGRAFKAIRDDETAAEAMGINLFKHKEMSFVISSSLRASPGTACDVSVHRAGRAVQDAMTYEILPSSPRRQGSVSGSCIASYSTSPLRMVAGGWIWAILASTRRLFRSGSGVRVFRFHHVDRSVLLQGVMGDKGFPLAACTTPYASEPASAATEATSKPELVLPLET